MFKAPTPSCIVSKQVNAQPDVEAKSSIDIMHEYATGRHDIQHIDTQHNDNQHTN